MKTILIAALLAVPAAPAFAQDSVHVAYNTRELATAAGREKLQRRVQRAVVRVCGTDRVPGTMLPDHVVRSCYKTTADRARPQVDRAIALANRGTEVASVGRR